MTRKLFGTDGVRGTANAFPVTVDNALVLGRTAVRYFQQASPIREGKHRIVVGKDTRLSSYMLEAAIAAGICSAGADAVLLGPLPTPGISFITRSMRADAGVVISASHNPYHDNGIKFFSKEGTKLTDEAELEIEEAFAQDSIEGLPTGREAGKIYRVNDAQGRYVEFLKSSFPRDLALDGIEISLDCANGAAYLVAPTVLSELGAMVRNYAKTPNGENINDHCGALYPENVAGKV
ncbi:MAG TPA: phosphoglucosamine mutase, partial [bacterium]|nr:phosphoglucosamine mutase [bacterium]